MIGSWSSRGGGSEFSPRVRDEMNKNLEVTKSRRHVYAFIVPARSAISIHACKLEHAKSTSIVFLFLFLFFFFFFFLVNRGTRDHELLRLYFLPSFLPRLNDRPLSVLLYTTQHFCNLFEFARRFGEIFQCRFWPGNEPRIFENHVVRRRSLR